MSEAAVALTDYALVAECGVLAALLARMAPASRERTLWLGFFAATATAALAGGTVHGFFSAAPSLVGSALWIATMLAIGVTGITVLALAAEIGWPGPVARTLARFGAVELVVYTAVVLFGTQAYWLALAQYAPFGALWLGVMVREWRRRRDRATFAGVTGLVTSFAAAAVQYFGIAIPAIGLDHNSLYHVIQAAGLALLFRCAIGRLVPARKA